MAKGHGSACKGITWMCIHNKMNCICDPCQLCADGF